MEENTKKGTDDQQTVRKGSKTEKEEYKKRRAHSDRQRILKELTQK